MIQTVLPVELTSFIGREKETADLQRLLQTSRLVTLTGAGGCGKTRLALWLAHRVKDNYVDGVFWVELTTITDESPMAEILAKAMNLSLPAGNVPIDALVEWLHNKQILIILDNCEHLLKASASLARKFLQEPGVHLLVTSREPLSVEGEVLYPVSPLSLPPLESNSADIPKYDAIQLFVQRAQAVTPAFELTPKNQQTVARICHRLDGLPLAIELASVRVNLLSVEQIEERLEDRFALLASSRSTDPHHRTLRAAVDWSYDLLASQEQILFRRLSIFPSDCSIRSIEAICAFQTIPQEQILALLGSLVNKSLVISETLTPPQARYRMLESIREYASEKLNKAEETKILRDRHLEYFLEQAESVDLKMHSQDQKLWLAWTETEHDNFRAALRSAIEIKNIEAGMRIANALTFFWNTHGYLSEGQRWLERLLDEDSGTVSPVIRARSATYAAILSNLLGDSYTAQKRGQEAIQLCENAGEESQPFLVMALVTLGASARNNGEFSQALKHLRQAVELSRRLNQKTNLALALQIQALTAMDLEDYEMAKTSLQEGLTIAHESKDAIRIAHICDYLGDLYRCEEKLGEALKWYEKSLAFFNEADAKRDVAGVTHNLAHTYWHLGEKQKAESLFRESMSLHQALKNRPGMAECLTGFSAILLDRELNAEVICLLTAVAIHGRNAVLQWPAERMEYNYYFEQARANLSDAKFEEAQTEGRNLSLEQAQEFAFYLLDKSSKRTTNIKQNPGGLTQRELEVAKLIGSGKSNIEIAKELVLSKRTVESHVAHILSKLGFENRPQIVRWAVENRLIMD